jgi:branched-chain amino acid aminotransferase
VTTPPEQLLVWVDGSFVRDPTTTPAISALDDVVLVGKGVFETMRMRAGRLFHRRRHLERLHSSAQIVGLSCDDTVVDAGIEAAVTRWGSRDGRVRLTITGGGSVIVAVGPLPAFDEVATAVTVPWPRNERSPLAGAKTTSYLDNTLAFEHARAAGATEALILNTRGEVCEGSRTNLFAVCGGRLITPPLSAGCLPGVTRALVLEHGDALEETIRPADLRRASEGFLTSTLRGAQPIATIDGEPIGNGSRPHADRLRRILDSLSADA